MSRVGSNIWFYYAENGRDRFKDQPVISTYVNKGRAYPKCHTNVEKALKSLEDSSLVRFDQKYMGMISNTSCLNDLNGGNITCSIDLKKDKEVVFSIPYSKGWTLYVDSKKQETNKANRMFLGARINRGQHQIELKYLSPGMKAGCTASVLGLLVVLILFSSPYIRQHCRSVWK